MHTFTSIAHKMVLGIGMACTIACTSNDPAPASTPTVQTTFSKTELDKLNVYIIAGDYYEMKIGVKGNQLTGIYQPPSSQSTDACSFFFEGTIGTQNPIEVTCYNPSNTAPPIKGTFKVLGDALIAQLNKLPNDQCEPQFTDAVGRSMVLDASHEWSEIRVIERPIALFDSPADGAVLDEQLSQGVVVAVKEKKGNWLFVQILDQNGGEGWIESHALYPLLDL